MSRWAILASTGYFLYRMAKQYVRRLRPDKTLHIGPGTDLVKCPRCYTYVPVDTSMRASINGYTVHFCSPECLEAYRRDGEDVDARAITENSNKT